MMRAPTAATGCCGVGRKGGKLQSLALPAPAAERIEAYLAGRDDVTGLEQQRNGQWRQRAEDRRVTATGRSDVGSAAPSPAQPASRVQETGRRNGANGSIVTGFSLELRLSWRPAALAP